MYRVVVPWHGALRVLAVQAGECVVSKLICQWCVRAGYWLVSFQLASCNFHITV
jgi:hypothetical protein